MALARKTPMARGTSQLKQGAPLKAKKPMDRTADPAPKKGPRARKCGTCREPFKPSRIGQQVCGPACAIEFAKIVTDKQVRKVDKARKAKLKGLREWIADAQVAFNAYVRARDRLAGHPCISSGLPLDWSGNNVDAGHYRSRGSAPHLRFDERNCHAQSKQQNRYASGNATDYRLGLIARIGLAEVERLEVDNVARKFTIDELRAIKAEYVAKLKHLKAQEIST